jgi:ribonuclease E
MAQRMLIDASHPEETRVVVLKGNRIEEFDFETSTKQTLKGNIYLAKVTRVEPSLQAAFVEYGGNRHGFLAFSEIHPDYYQIPVADRQALLEAQAAEDAAQLTEEEEAEARALEDTGPGEAEPAAEPDEVAVPSDSLGDSEPEAETAPDNDGGDRAMADNTGLTVEVVASEPVDALPAETIAGDDREPPAAEADTLQGDTNGDGNGETASHVEEAPVQPIDVATVGGDVLDEVRQPRRRMPVRQYKIQEVIKRRQILLVQVVKEERGNKGAALTTYLSLAGRYCVLMPNTARGGGISRKIVSAADRRRLKTIAQDLDPPQGMGVIVRTAGMERSKTEIKRDFEFLLHSWDQIRELTLRSTAPAVVYEEGTLIKRAIRDVYHKEVEEVWVEGENGYRQAKDLMKVLMPEHAKRVQPYRDRVPLFHRFNVEPQLDAMYNPVVQLKSGGYIVINTTEALVAIDVNSGRSTREHNIEETAYRTNLEAAEEVARQLRLRDLAGLIVIDFIDMEIGRNIRNVERRLKDCLKGDRARIQVGRISPFGLMEMSRQRLRPSLIEASTRVCPHCNGVGHVRSVESTALHVLRAIEDEGIRDRTDEMTVYLATAVAIYLLNHKRKQLAEIERRYGTQVAIAIDDTLVPPASRIDRTKTRTPDQGRIEALKEWRAEPVYEEGDLTAVSAPVDDEPLVTDDAETPELTEAGDDEAAPTREGERGDAERGDGNRRRRRRRGGRRDEKGAEGESGDETGETRPPRSAPPVQTPANALDFYAGADFEDGSANTPETANDDAAPAAPAADGEVGEDGPRRRRRGRRGGRRQRGDRPANGEAQDAPSGETPAPLDPAETEQPVVTDWQPTGWQPAPEPEPVVTPEVVTPQPALAPAVAVEPVAPVEPVAEPAPAPARVPAGIVVTSSDEAPAEKKTRFGWWRRKG